mgnify:CR=1 FL=1
MKIRQETLDRISQLNRAGCNDCEISRQLGISPSRVASARDKLGLDRVYASSELLDIACRIYHEGQGRISYSDVADMLGLSRNSIAGAVYRRKRATARKYGRAA